MHYEVRVLTSDENHRDPRSLMSHLLTNFRMTTKDVLRSAVRGLIAIRCVPCALIGFRARKNVRA